MHITKEEIPSKHVRLMRMTIQGSEAKQLQRTNTEIFNTNIGVRQGECQL